MPYESDAQRKFFNAQRAALEAQGVDVDEWNSSSRGKKLPKRVKKKKKKAGDSQWLKVATYRLAAAHVIESARPGSLLYRAAGRVLKMAGSHSQGSDPSVLSVLGPPLHEVVRSNPPVGGGSQGDGRRSMDAARVKLGSMRRGHLLRGPNRLRPLARRHSEKTAFTGRAAIQGDPNQAWQQLMGMVKPGPAVGPAGTNQKISTPGGEMGGRNTPSTNPIGMMSGLGVDPGGSSVMGNAAFGTNNNVVKIALRRILAG